MVAIKDMEMPKGCEDCPCFHSVACYAEGYRREVTLGYIERREKREEWCPLVEVIDDCD